MDRQIDDRRIDNRQKEGGADSMIVYKFDVLAALKGAGYSTYDLQKDKLLPQTVIQKLRTGNTDISVKTLGKICDLLEMQPGNILKRVEDEE